MFFYYMTCSKQMNLFSNFEKQRNRSRPTQRQPTVTVEVHGFLYLRCTLRHTEEGRDRGWVDWVLFQGDRVSLFWGNRRPQKLYSSIVGDPQTPWWRGRDFV